MPSSSNRRRIEVPIHFHDQLAEIARKESRTITNVLQELLFFGLMHYRSGWIPNEHLDRLTPEARRVLELMVEEARAFNHHYLGTEHVLLGLLRVEESIAARVLTGLGLDLDGTRQAVERIIGRGDAPAEGELEYTPRVRRVLGLAVEEAGRLGHEQVGTEHILLGLVREGEGVAAGILAIFGILKQVRPRTLALLAERETSTAGRPAPAENEGRESGG